MKTKKLELSSMAKAYNAGAKAQAERDNMKTKKANTSECGITHHAGAMSASGPCPICGKHIDIKPQHTLTPWEMKGEFITANRGGAVCQLFAIDSKEEMEANAAFIVKAVNSHEELVKIAVLTKKYLKGERVTGPGLLLNSLVDKALTKAEGGK